VSAQVTHEQLMAKLAEVGTRFRPVCPRCDGTGWVVDVEASRSWRCECRLAE